MATVAGHNAADCLASKVIGRGVGTVRMISETATEIGIDTVTLYCLSSENWKRPKQELDFLMHLLEQYLIEERRTIMEQGLRLQVIGRRDRLPATVLAEMKRTIEMSASNRGTRLVLAIDYGGRDELTRVARILRPKFVTERCSLTRSMNRVSTNDLIPLVCPMSI